LREWDGWLISTRNQASRNPCRHQERANAAIRPKTRVIIQRRQHIRLFVDEALRRNARSSASRKDPHEFGETFFFAPPRIRAGRGFRLAALRRNLRWLSSSGIVVDLRNHLEGPAQYPD